MLQHGIVLCAALAFTASVAPGAVIFSSFTSTPPGYLDNILFSIAAGPAPGPPNPLPSLPLVSKQEWAMGFVPTTSAVAERVSVPLQFESGQVRFLLAESLN